jgi:hypothetical protein
MTLIKISNLNPATSTDVESFLTELQATDTAQVLGGSGEKGYGGDDDNEGGYGGKKGYDDDDDGRYGKYRRPSYKPVHYKHFPKYYPSYH